MKIETKIIYPCGYVYQHSYRGFPLFAIYKFDTNDLPICPIHGKSCK